MTVSLDPRTILIIACDDVPLERCRLQPATSRDHRLGLSELIPRGKARQGKAKRLMTYVAPAVHA